MSQFDSTLGNTWKRNNCELHLTFCNC